MTSIHPLDILNFLHSKDERSDPQCDTRKIENEKVTNTNRSSHLFMTMTSYYAISKVQSERLVSNQVCSLRFKAHPFYQMIRNAR